MKHKSPGLHIAILIAFLLNSFGFIPVAQADVGAYSNTPLLSKPGVMVHLSPPMNPAILKGIKVHPDNPFRFDFILDVGDGSSVPKKGEETSPLRDESKRLIKYFLASLTIPEKDLWVNLSPYEKDRIVPESFGVTEMGRDLLAQDYMLKQITASLIYPEDEVGKKFWKRIYEEAQKKYNTTNIPVNTFNKVWIVPEKAVVYENAKAGTAYVVESRLKVMLECDYLAMSKHDVGAGSPSPIVKGGETPPLRADINQIGSQIVREIVIPELTKEINEGKNFSQLRQVYNSLILATWYKKKIKDSILSKVYADKNKTKGIGIDDVGAGSPSPMAKGGETPPLQDVLNTERIYQQYLTAFKKGVYNYIKEDVDPVSQVKVPRKYFSGGMKLSDKAMQVALEITPNANRLPLYTNDLAMVSSQFNVVGDPAMSARSGDQLRLINDIDPALLRIFYGEGVGNSKLLKVEQPSRTRRSSQPTVGFEIEGQLKDHPDLGVRGRDYPQDLWRSVAERFYGKIDAILPNTWARQRKVRQGQTPGNFFEITTNPKGDRNTDEFWKETVATIDALQKVGEGDDEHGPLIGGITSIHANFGDKDIPLKANGDLMIDEARFGRVVKVYEAMWRALAGKGWSEAPTGILSAPTLASGKKDIGGNVRNHTTTINYSDHLEIKFLEGDISTEGPAKKIDTSKLRQRTAWGFNLLNFVADLHDAGPLAVLGLPVLAGHKPSNKQIDRFLELFFGDDAEGLAFAADEFRGLNDVDAGKKYTQQRLTDAEVRKQEAQRRSEDLEVRAYYVKLGLKRVYERHSAREGYDDKLEEYFLDPINKDELEALAEDLVRAGHADKEALGYFTNKMHEKLSKALAKARVILIETGPIKKFNLKDIVSINTDLIRAFTASEIDSIRAIKHNEYWGNTFYEMDPVIRQILNPNLLSNSGEYVRREALLESIRSNRTSDIIREDAFRNIDRTVLQQSFERFVSTNLNVKESNRPYDLDTGRIRDALQRSLFTIGNTMINTVINTVINPVSISQNLLFIPLWSPVIKFNLDAIKNFLIRSDSVFNLTFIGPQVIHHNVWFNRNPESIEELRKISRLALLIDEGTAKTLKEKSDQLNTQGWVLPMEVKDNVRIFVLKKQSGFLSTDGLKAPFSVVRTSTGADVFVGQDLIDQIKKTPNGKNIFGAVISSLLNWVTNINSDELAARNVMALRLSTLGLEWEPLGQLFNDWVEGKDFSDQLVWLNSARKLDYPNDPSGTNQNRDRAQTVQPDQAMGSNRIKKPDVEFPIRVISPQGETFKIRDLLDIDYSRIEQDGGWDRFFQESGGVLTAVSLPSKNSNVEHLVYIVPYAQLGSVGRGDNKIHRVLFYGRSFKGGYSTSKEAVEIIDIPNEGESRIVHLGMGIGDEPDDIKHLEITVTHDSISIKYLSPKTAHISTNAKPVNAGQDRAMTSEEINATYIPLLESESRKILQDALEMDQGHIDYVKRFYDALLTSGNEYYYKPFDEAKFKAENTRPRVDDISHLGVLKDDQGKYWIIKVKEIKGTKEVNLKRREKLAYLLAQKRANAAPIRGLTQEQAQVLGIPAENADDYYLTQIVNDQNISKEDLYHKDKGRAFAGILVLNFLTRIYDNHLFNFGFTNGLPVAFDNDLLGLEDEVPVSEVGNARFILNFVYHAVLLLGADFINNDVNGYKDLREVTLEECLQKLKVLRNNFIQGKSLGTGWINAESLTIKNIKTSIIDFKKIKNIEELAQEAGYEGEEIDQIARYLKKTQSTLGADLDRLWELLTGQAAGFSKLDSMQFIGGDKKAGEAVVEFSDQVWISAGSLRFKVGVNDNRVTFQRISEDAKGSIVTFNLGDDFSVGAAEDNSYVNEDPLLSGHHFVFNVRQEDGRNIIKVNDLGSSNGTIVEKVDSAMKTNTGGIDFNADKMNLQIQNASGGISFKLDPAMLKQLQNAPGFTPVIINIQPMTDLRVFLGLNEDKQDNVYAKVG